MSNVVVHPSSMEGIKRLAKQLKHETNLPHNKALEQAARAAGFPNFQNARNTLPPADTTSRKRRLHPLYLTAYWRTPEGDSGRETLLIHSRQCWPPLLTPRQLYASRLRHFRVDAADHLETRVDLHGQNAARNAVCVAAATIQFMEASGLRLPTKMIPRASKPDVHTLPGRDHATVWVNPTTEHWVFGDEPYRDSPEFLAERMAWAEQRGMTIRVIQWPGMYAPGMSTLYLLARNEFASELAAMTGRLNALPDPPTANDWQGSSEPYNPVFVSPGREASGRVKRSRPRNAYPGLVRGKAIAYGRTFVGMQWRPHAKMPLASHKRVGALLKRLKELGVLSPAWHRIESVRSTLDEWIQREYKVNELPHEQFDEMYYGTSMASDTNKVGMVAEVVDRLKASYPDCGPRRLVLRTLTSIHRTIENHEASKAARKPSSRQLSV